MKWLIQCFLGLGFSFCFGLSAIADTPPKELEIQDFEFLSNQCRSLLETKAYTEALKMCEKAIPLAPKRQKPIELWKFRAQALFGLEKYQDAIVAFNYILTLEPTYSQGLLQRCEALSKLGQLEAALESCDQGLQRDGDWGTLSPAQGWYQQGLTLRKLGKLKDAIVAYDRALLADPNHALIKVERCEVLLEIEALPEFASRKSILEDQESAIEQQCFASNQQPSALALYKYGMMFWQAGIKRKSSVDPRNQVKEDYESTQSKLKMGYKNLKAAIAAYEQELAQNPTDASAWMNQGIAAQTTSDTAKAIVAFEKVLQLNPASSQAMALRCAIFNQQKQYQEALTICEASLKGDNRWQPHEFAAAWTQQSLALLGLKQYERAVLAADQATKLDPESAEAYHFLAIGQWYLKNFNEAERAAELAIQKNKSYARAYFTLARTLSSRGDSWNAQANYSSALVIYDLEVKLFGEIGLAIADPTFQAAIVTNKAATDLRLGLTTRVNLDELDSAEPRTIAGVYNRAAVLLSQGRYTDALQAFERVEKLQPNNADVLLGKAISLENIASENPRTLQEKLEKLQRAIDAYDAVLALRPRESAITNKREDLLKQLNAQQEKLREQEAQRLNQGQLTPAKK